MRQKEVPKEPLLFFNNGRTIEAREISKCTQMYTFQEENR